ncbi:hypothetical protein [Paenibacillus alginolyticus]|uniref:Uncharacterized protein n=1 Tax=Paenibacillus alginolyticus TaxID=59839 RepID=A0ABT4GJP3_9BACL|nr:hypothetical protein [Paenibacillus alginolyticus]MCY9696422.1 hypothetical protein [Paenibacillus alginolyticus]MEC0145263.1 hypothetical protein [Paenibacillus alginolyticus]
MGNAAQMDVRDIVSKLRGKKELTLAGFNECGMPYYHHIIAGKVEVIQGLYWDGKLKPIDTLQIEAEHPGNKNVLPKGNYDRYLFNTRDVVPKEYRFNEKQKGGFMIFEGWHQEPTITKIPHLMYKSALLNKKIPIILFMERISAFDVKLLEIVKEKIGVEPIVSCMVDRGWLDIKKQEDKLKKVKPVEPKRHVTTQTQFKLLVPQSSVGQYVYNCKHGCSYQSTHRGSMNLHEYRHCKMMKTT